MLYKRNKFLIFLLWIMKIRLVFNFTSSLLCGRIPGLTPQQRQLCTESPDAFIALGEGHQLGAQECQYQFRGHRWNCSQVWKSDVFGHVMFVGSREAAFTYGIASAGATHAITAACARGNISLCGCDVRHKPTTRRSSYEDFEEGVSGGEEQQPWKWGGCSADIEFGMKFARKFLDAREIEGDARSLMNLHNNRVGRRLIKNLLKTDCKCHGVSGSCVMKTCWKSLPAFRVVGDVLMKKYLKAKIVQAVKGKNGLKLIVSKKNRAVKANNYPKRMDLIYLQASPNYCERNLLVGVQGTQGRICNRTLRGLQSCDLLCCGRGYNTHQIRRTNQCRCEFKWCCQVQCDVCEENYEEFSCK
ncbi:protein Wnt-2 [Glossina fuscipes]|uniref:Protein Wnt n=2 Tax=Nemorhina TaxID=44051 RepID=A0A9C5Z0X7_9MUSC|nr:protein Wnt-2 [Glossina fuscipes]